MAAAAAAAAATVKAVAAHDVGRGAKAAVAGGDGGRGTTRFGCTCPTTSGRQGQTAAVSSVSPRAGARTVFHGTVFGQFLEKPSSYLRVSLNVTVCCVNNINIIVLLYTYTGDSVSVGEDDSRVG